MLRLVASPVMTLQPGSLRVLVQLRAPGPMRVQGPLSAPGPLRAPGRAGEMIPEVVGGGD